MHFIRFVMFIAAFMLTNFAVFSVSFAETDKVIEAEAELAAAAVVGQKAPDFTLRGVDGKEHSLSDFTGQPVVLEWTNHECPYVVKHYDSGNMQNLQKEAVDNGVIWLSVVSSAPGKQGHTSQEEGKALHEAIGSHATSRLMDESGDVGRLYGAKTTPHMYVLDAAGVLVYAGAIDDQPSFAKEALDGAYNYVRAALDQLQSGKPIETAQTKPYGCSVKY